MELSRRGLFGALASTLVGYSLGDGWSETASDRIPELVGDGVEDDTLAVQAYLDRGEPIPYGTYRLTAPLICQNDSFIIDGCRLRIDHPGYTIVVQGGVENGRITNNVFEFLQENDGFSIEGLC